jgi:DNA-binding GntR family transcriptional regulator
VLQATTSVIAASLRDAVTRGQIPAGTPLRQDRIAAQFGVSHIPVREALQQLAAEGLAVLIHNRGYVVSELSPEAVWELTEYRALLEGEMARCAVPNLTRVDLDGAAAVLDDLDRATDILETLRLAAVFHTIIYRRAERPFFLKSIEAVRGNLARYWRLAWEDVGFKPHSQDEHRRILSLCRRRKADDVKCEVERHIRATGTLIIEYLRDQASPSTRPSKTRHDGSHQLPRS